MTKCKKKKESEWNLSNLIPYCLFVSLLHLYHVHVKNLSLAHFFFYYFSFQQNFVTWQTLNIQQRQIHCKCHCKRICSNFYSFLYPCLSHSFSRLNSRLIKWTLHSSSFDLSIFHLKDFHQHCHPFRAKSDLMRISPYNIYVFYINEDFLKE